MSIFCSLIREECNTFHSQSTVKTLESASQLPYRHMWRRCVCCQENKIKCRKVAYFRAFCKVGIIREALRKARFSCMETYLLFSLAGEKLNGRRITVGV